jgi:hypothetical protein
MIEHKSRPEWVAVEQYLSDAVVHQEAALRRAVQSAADAKCRPSR